MKPTIVGSLTTLSGANVDLTAEGVRDWAHWGYTNNFDHKASGGGQISTYSVIGGASVSTYNGGATSFTWSDGTPDTSASNSPTGVYVTTTGSGFQITAPADVTTRTLRVYLGVHYVQGQLTATLSGGGPTYSSSALTNNSSAGTNGVYTLTYNGSTSGQTLTVTFTKTGDFSGNNTGKLALQSATLGP